MSRSTILAALDDAHVPHPSEISRITPYRPDGTVMAVEWSPIAGWRPSWGGGSEHVWAYVCDVASDERAVIESAFRNSALPDLVNWLRFASTAPEGWRVLRHRRVWRWSDGALVADDDR